MGEHGITGKNEHVVNQCVGHDATCRHRTGRHAACYVLLEGEFVHGFVWYYESRHHTRFGG